MRRNLRWLWAQFVAASGGLWWAKQRLRAEGAIVPLTFHRVLDEASRRQTNSQSGMVIREKTFRDLVTYVARHYEPVDLDAAAPGRADEKLRVAFTFDDGWRDNYRTAFPIARNCNIPLLIFLCPALIGKQMPFWPERAVALLRALYAQIQEQDIDRFIERLKTCAGKERERCLAELAETASKHGTSPRVSSADSTLTWSEIAEMARAGVRFGSHTQTHQILATVCADTVQREIVESKSTLERVLGKSCDTFSYPNGNWSPDARRAVETAGYKKAVTVGPGAWTRTSDPLCIPRINIHETTVVGITGRFSPVLFEYATFWRAWRAMMSDSRARAAASVVAAV